MNIGKRGISGFSIGRRGASLGVGNQGAHLNAGVPGTGISYRQRIGSAFNMAGAGSLITIVLLIIGGIFMCGLCVITGNRSSNNTALKASPTREAIVPLLSTPSPTPTSNLKTSKQKKSAKTTTPLVVAPLVTQPEPSRRSNGPRQSGLIRGPRGGCYYINSHGKKTYVDRSECN